MIVAGVFVVWYWAPVLVSGASVLGSNPFPRTIDEFTAHVAGVVAANPILSRLVLTLIGPVTRSRAGVGCQPLTAPMVKPEMKRSRKALKSRAIGTATRMTAA